LIRIRVHHPYPHATRLRVHDPIERHGRETPLLNRDERVSPPLDDVFGRAVAQVTGVFEIEGYRVRAADFVADVLVYDGGLDAELREARPHPRFADLAEAYFFQPNVTVLVALCRRELGNVFGTHNLSKTFGENDDSVLASAREALDDRAGQRIDDRSKAYGPLFELFGN